MWLTIVFSPQKWGSYFWTFEGAARMSSYGMIPSGILTWQSKFYLQTRKYTLQQVNFPWIVLDCRSVQMLVFPLVFAVDEVKVYIHSHLCKHCNCNTRWFWKFSKIHFCFFVPNQGGWSISQQVCGERDVGKSNTKNGSEKKISTWRFGHLEVMQCQTHLQIWLDLTCHDDKAVQQMSTKSG